MIFSFIYFHISGTFQITNITYFNHTMNYFLAYHFSLLNCGITELQRTCISFTWLYYLLVPLKASYRNNYAYDFNSVQIILLQKEINVIKSIENRLCHNVRPIGVVSLISKSKV